MALANGTRLGTFEILALVGAGGMGEVYRARDTRLDRTVAIKVLPQHWADDPEMKQRFEIEAQTIASLNHPHICTLHDIGRQPADDSGRHVDFLVMEYLEGETLAQRLERGALPLDEALRVAIAIADALDKAHRRGVTHRDLKPGNVFLVRGSGASDPPIAKLLDFGLAKASGPVGTGSSSTPSKLATTPRQLTARGAILGTLQYMAPEQLEGHEADARTDIFAFGVILHEMVTGRKTFEGKSRVLLMSAIATAEPPPLSSAQPAASPALDHVVRTCLAKDPADRWQTARDLLAELQWIAAAGRNTLAPKRASPARRMRSGMSLAIAAAALLALAAVAASVFYFQGSVQAAESRIRIPIQLSAETTQLVGPNNLRTFAVSPDSKTVAFVADTFSDPAALFVRPVGSITPQRLAAAAGTALGSSQLFWSADSKSIAFVSAGKLMKVEATGGPPQEICEVPDFAGGDWNRDGTILFGTSHGVFRVSAQGGAKPEPVTTVAAPESGHFWPHFLPDGRRFLYLAWSADAGGRAIFAGSLDSKDRSKVISAESKAAYAEPGYLVFRREGAIYAQPFNARSLTVSADPVRIADGVVSASNGDGAFSVAHTGALLYYFNFFGGPAATFDTSEWQLSWVDRRGTQLGTAGPFGLYRGAEVSPDGGRIAVHKHDAGGGDIFVIEPRGATTQLTFDASHHNSSPIWSPDGTKVVYSSLQKGKWGLYQTLSNGSGTEELLYESELPKAPMSWSTDGKQVVFWVQDPKTAGDIWVLTVDGKKPAPFLATPFNETHPQLSFDGKWIAYTSNSTGGRNEIWVRPFPTGSGVYRISKDGGDWARWNRNTKEILFHSLIAGQVNPGMILSATVGAVGSALEPLDPKEVVATLALDIAHSGGDYHTFSLSPDGERLLIYQLVLNSDPATDGGPALSADPPFGLVAALNWTASLQK
ncbi:MAG TPA: protein kinase [Vicinamibacterales bacterium]|nr:protein kinase [Vicinamibacterales bacterium]